MVTKITLLLVKNKTQYGNSLLKFLVGQAQVSTTVFLVIIRKRKKKRNQNKKNKPKKPSKPFLISKGNSSWASQIRNAREKPRVEIRRLHTYGTTDLRTVSL